MYRSNVVKSDLNPTWEEAEVEMETFCNGDVKRTIKIKVWDHRRSGKPKPIGEVEMSVESLLEATRNGQFEIMGKDSKLYGSIEVMNAKVKGPKRRSSVKRAPAKKAPPPSSIPAQIFSHQPLSLKKKPEFVDYLTGGCQISLAVAIDFTASNGKFGSRVLPAYRNRPRRKLTGDYFISLTIPRESWRRRSSALYPSGISKCME